MSRHYRQQRKRARRLAQRLANPPAIMWGGTKSIVRRMQEAHRKAADKFVDEQVYGRLRLQSDTHVGAPAPQPVRKVGKIPELAMGYGIGGDIVHTNPKATPTELLLAAVRANPGMLSGALAKHVGCSVGTASTTLRRLCEQGKIERRHHTSTSYAYYPVVEVEL